MDVIAGRKTQGKITGDILVNGERSNSGFLVSLDFEKSHPVLLPLCRVIIASANDLLQFC